MWWVMWYRVGGMQGEGEEVRAWVETRPKWHIGEVNIVQLSLEVPNHLQSLGVRISNFIYVF